MKRHKLLCNHKILSIFIGLLCILFPSCVNKNDKRIVESLVGKEFIIPDDLQIQILDSIQENNINQSNYKIITYVDSAGCTACKMKLGEWELFLEEIKSATNKKVDFLMFVDSTDKEDILNIAAFSNFLYPLAIDNVSKYPSFEILKEGSMYNSILLDSENNILVIGNPLLNHKVRSLYTSLISNSN